MYMLRRQPPNTNGPPSSRDAPRQRPRAGTTKKKLKRPLTHLYLLGTTADISKSEVYLNY